MHYFPLYLLFHAVHLDLLYEDSIIHVYEKIPLVLMHCWNQEGNFHFPACFRCVNIENKCYFLIKMGKGFRRVSIILEVWVLQFCWSVELAVLRMRIGVCYTQKAITVEMLLWPVSSSLCFLLHFAFVKIFLHAINKLQEIQFGFFYCNTLNCKVFE